MFLQEKKGKSDGHWKRVLKDLIKVSERTAHCKKEKSVLSLKMGPFQ